LFGLHFWLCSRARKAAQRLPARLPLRVPSEGQLLFGLSLTASFPLQSLPANSDCAAAMGLPVIPGRSAAVVPPSGGIDSLALEQPESLVSIPLHPLGVKPSGNQYTAPSNARHATGFFQILPDEVVATVLEYLDAPQLDLLGSCCKFLYAFCRSEDLWKALFIE
jgi:hypothetical protein